jgi:hypothetical protein
MSILTVFCLIISFIYFSKDFYLRQNPIIIVQLEIFPVLPLYEIANDNIFLAYKIVDSNGNNVN